MIEQMKEFKLSSFSIKNKTSVYVLTFIILLVGLGAYTSMPKESFPEIKQPTIYVGTAYPGNSPVDMENLVTRPIEKELKSLKGVKKFKSTSIQDYSTIIVEFELDVEVSKALQDVKDAVDKSKVDLPTDLPADPNVFELDFSEFPVMNINLSGNFSYDVLKENAEYLEDEIEKFPEVSEVDIRGLLEKEVEISVDRYAMEAAKISFADIENAVRGENVSMSGGDILSVSGESQNRRSLRISGEFKDYKEIENVIVKDENQDIVYLRDIAKVSFGPVEPTSYARLNTEPVVFLDVKKKSGENLLNAADKIKHFLTVAEKNKLPKGMSVLITNDQSKNTVDMVSNLENSIISGVILVVLVLLFFMGGRNSMFVGIAIPLSMLMAVAIVNFLGTTLNMMVLFSLILALGMLVDNGIVVVENIYRLYSQGMSKVEAARYGVGEVAVPIIASTLTTLAAFFPLLFWQSLMGEFMKYLPITLIVTLSASLFVGLVINPVLAANFMKIEGIDKKATGKTFWIISAGAILLGLAMVAGAQDKTLGNLLIIFGVIRIAYRFVLQPASERFQNSFLPKLENAYANMVAKMLKSWRPYALFFGMIVLMVASIMIWGASNPKVLFFPENDPQYVNVFIEMPLGTDIEKTNDFSKMVEKRIIKALEPNKNIVEAVVTSVGEGTSDPNEGPSQGSSPHKARVTISFIETAKRVFISDTSTSRLMEVIAESVEDLPEANIVVQKNSEGPPVGKPINVEVSGPELNTLITLTDRLKKKMVKADLAGVDKLKTDLETGKPELVISIDREAARRFGLSTYSIANTIRTALFGKEISKLKQGEDDYKIQLRLQDHERYDISSLLNQKITFRTPKGVLAQVPISAVASIDFGSTYGSVKRIDTDKVISIFSEVKTGYNANAIVAEFKELLKDEKLPEGYTLKFTGEQEEQDASSEFLGRAFGIAFMLIFLIIVAQFNSILMPAVIMFSVLFSTTGVFLGLAIFKMEFVLLMTGIGIISLAGVVVNNAIVLIDYTNQLRARKRVELGLHEDERLPMEEIVGTIVEAGRTRLRPVLLTAITTVLGLIPLAIGLNINFFTFLSSYDAQYYTGGDSAMFWGPMSWTVIFGLTFATFLTLVVVPAMYLLTDQLTHLVKNLFGMGRKVKTTSK
ncbi:MAG: efflux RND transporter permease subunit [Bacteroidetes bacterium]|nr:MAG: efflux RND transporter permease subunit [Bacteroidota bacterium]